MRPIAVALLAVWALAPAGAAPRVENRGVDWMITGKALRVTLSPATGRMAVLDRRTGYIWRQPGGAWSPAWRNVRALPDGVALTADFGETNGRPNTINVSIRMRGDTGDLAIEADTPDRQSPMGDFDSLAPPALDTDRGVMAVADYSDGHLYPLGEEPFPRTWFGGDRLDMPWVGLCDMDKGFGYCVILETCENAAVHMVPHNVGTRKVYAPAIRWLSSKGRLEFPRRLLYRFVPRGGYVALAQAYRAYARSHGMIVPFTEKVKRNPNIRRLFGAVDVWGDATLRFAREAKSLGVDRMLIHGRSTPAEMRAINALGYLTSEYDNYTDILPVERGQEPDSSHGSVPADVVMNADGSRMTAWLTYDKKTQFMKRCPAMWVPTARLVVPKVLKAWPFLGRFVDVTTAEGLYECFDPAHPLNKVDKRHMGELLLAYMRSQKLVVGGEHGIWWGAPHQDYIEGMMSGNRFAWPAGHLIHPKDRSEKFAGPYGTETWDVYDRWSIGHEWRAPLWELVFHDCVVPTWYWGDSNDYLLDAAPEYTAKKDAFNILYGTMPMLWADGGGSWIKARDVFLRTCRVTSKVHQAVADSAMVSHEFVTADHAVQRTRFANGTVAIVNFGREPRKVVLAGRAHLLPQDGFAVKGPRVEQVMEIRGGKAVTEIRAPGYAYTDAQGAGIAMSAAGAGMLNLTVTNASGSRSVLVRPRDAAPGWDVASTTAYARSADGARDAALAMRREGSALRINLPTGGGDRTAIDLICGRAAAHPDLAIGAVTVSMRPKRAALAAVRVANLGSAPVSGATVRVYDGSVAANRILASARVDLASRQERSVRVPFDARALDGSRVIAAAVSAPRGVRELCDRNNAGQASARFARPHSDWPSSARIEVSAGEFDRAFETLRWRIPTADVAPGSVRMTDAAGIEAPAQYVATGPDAGTVLFTSPSPIPAGARRQFMVRWAPKAMANRFRSQAGTMYAPAAKEVQARTYALRLADGTITGVAAVRGRTAGRPFIKKLIYSSAETGWVDEPGKITRFETVEDGPVRLVIAVRKELSAGVTYDKTYTFEADRFTVETHVNRNVGVPSRAYYLRKGTFLDSGGLSAQVDGFGDGDGVSDVTVSPKWYAVYSPEWSEVCAALDPVSRITYWDSTDWGGIGFVGWQSSTQRCCYVIGAGSGDATFADRTWQALRSSPEVKTIP